MLLATYDLPLTTYYLLLTTYYLLHTTYYLALAGCDLAMGAEGEIRIECKVPHIYLLDAVLRAVSSA